MSDKSREAEADTFFDDISVIFILGGIYAVTCTTSSLIEHSAKIKELFSRLEKCEKNHELKK